METREEIYTKAQHEREMTRMEMQNKRLFMLVLILTAMLFITNGAWVIYEMSYQDIYITQDGYVDGDGANYLNGTGEMNMNGSESEADDPDTGEAWDY